MMSNSDQQGDNHGGGGQTLFPNGSTNRMDEVLTAIQPVRDLAKNWDIDIASCLDDFLQDLMEGSWAGGSLSMSLDQDTTTTPAMTATTTTAATNFAQAALLVQNSSSVYSRKVEYLHGLVYQALEQYSRGMQQQAPKNNNKANNNNNTSLRSDPDLDEFYAFDPHQEFLLLDDVIPIDRQGNKINLPPSKATDELNPSRNSFSRLSFMSRNSTMYNNNSNGKNNRSSAGAMSQLNVSIPGLPSNNQSSGFGMGPLRLTDTRCHISEQSGLMLWPGLGHPHQEAASSTANQETSSPPTTRDNQTSPRVNRILMMDDNGDDDDDDNKDGDGFAMVGGDDQDDYRENDHLTNHPSSPVPAPTTAINANADSLKNKVTTKMNPTKNVPNNPWAQFDPYDTTITAKHQRPRRLKVSKTLQLPPGFSDLPSQCVTGASTRSFSVRRTSAAVAAASRQAHQLGSIRSSVASQVYRGLLKRHSGGCNRVAKGIDDDDDDMDTDSEETVDGDLRSLLLSVGAAMDEMDYIKTRLTKLRAARHRRELRQLGTAAQLQQPERVMATDADEFKRNDDDEYGGDFYDDGDNDQDNDEDGNAIAEEGNSASNNNTGLLLSVLDSLPKRGDSSAPSSSEQHRQPTFDELCRAHIQAFSKHAQRFATETKLTQRVATWQEKIFPLLQEEEARPPFDIYKYSSQVIASMQQELFDESHEHYLKKTMCSVVSLGTEVKPPVVDFQVVARDCPHYEVCRLFLASLSLANSGNVQLLPEEAISCQGATTSPSSINVLPMKLLRLDIDQPMETYLAPSAVAAARAVAPSTNTRKRTLEGA